MSQIADFEYMENGSAQPFVRSSWQTNRVWQIAAIFVLWQGCMYERNSQTVRRWLIV
jgi:hypothetical protein